MSSRGPAVARPALSRSAVFGVRRSAPRGGRVRFLLDEHRSLLRGSVLDVGAGTTGPVLARELGAGYHALDIGDGYTIENDRIRGALRSVVDLERDPLPFDSASFDTVLCLDVLEHLDAPHRVRDELFRVARRHVLVSLPNNWPGFVWSLLAGTNVSHRAGYGLGAAPKRPGERHKHWFNLEEALDFLTGSVPDGWRVQRVDGVFEHGNDGLIASSPPFRRFFRLAGKATLQDAHERFGAAAVPAYALAKAVYAPLRLVDLALTAAMWGWGRPERYYNVWCRQLWVVFERTGAARG